MEIVSFSIRKLNTARLKKIELFKKYPVEIQQKSFYDLIQKAESTEWGRNYGYSSISSVREYQSRVPLQTYEDLIPYIERLGNGESDLLWPGEIKWFARSSGTTSTKSKYIPISRESLEDCHFRAAKDIILIYLMNNPASRLLSGKALTLGGSHRIGKFSNNALYGDLSAILIENTPFYAEIIRTPKREIALKEDFEKKLELITKSTINQNVTSFSGVPSWYLTLIKYILAYTGKSNLLEVWPNLEVFFHGGISFTPYLELYKKLINGNQMHYMETYNASEGFFGIQDDPSVSDLLLMPGYGIFYEFIPADRMNSDCAPACTLGEVEKGVNYVMVISTNGGLWRYVIGDTIIFNNLDPFRFHISGRTKHFMNAFGEEVIIENADRALEIACKATGAIISEYTAGPVFMGENSKGSHEWIIEFEKKPDNIERFSDILDETLKSINSDYEAKRYKDINLVRPLIRPVPKGTFYKWLKLKNKLGGQNKVPRLSNTRDLIEEINRILEV
jgi:hypothetical protein